MRIRVRTAQIRHLLALPLGIAALLLGSYSAALAQSAHGPLLGTGYRPATAASPRVRVGIPDNALTHGLNLSQTQINQILAIDASYEPELLALMADHPRFATQAYRAAHNAKFRAWKEHRMAEVRALLTPAQRARLDDNVAAFGDRHFTHGLSFSRH